jgi:hypothetical protein
VKSNLFGEKMTKKSPPKRADVQHLNESGTTLSNQGQQRIGHLQCAIHAAC